MYIQREINKWWVQKYNLYGVVVIQRDYCVVLCDIIGGDGVFLCDKEEDGDFWCDGDCVVLCWNKGGDGVGVCKIIGGDGVLDGVVSYDVV